jgi:hypothetical protein
MRHSYEAPRRSATEPKPGRGRWRLRLIDVLLPLSGGLLGAAGMPFLLDAGHRLGYVLYAGSIVIACNIASVTIAPPRRAHTRSVDLVRSARRFRLWRR